MRIKDKLISCQKPNELIVDYEHLYGKNKFPIYIADATKVITPSKEYLKQVDVLVAKLTAKGFPKFSEIRQYFREDLSNFDHLFALVDPAPDIIAAQFTIDEIKKNLELILFSFIEMEGRGFNILAFTDIVKNMEFACEVGGLGSLKELLGKITGDSFEEILYQAKYSYISQIASAQLTQIGINNENANSELYGRHFHNGMMLAAAEQYNLQLNIIDRSASSTNERSQRFLENLHNSVNSEEGANLLIDRFSDSLTSRLPQNFNGNQANKINKLEIVRKQLAKILFIDTNYLLGQIIKFDRNSLPISYTENHFDFLQLAVRVSLDRQDYIDGGVIYNGNKMIILHGNNIFFYRSNNFFKFNISSIYDTKFLIDNLLQSENRDPDLLTKIFNYQIDGTTLLSLIFNSGDRQIICSMFEILIHPKLVANLIDNAQLLELRDGLSDTILHKAVKFGYGELVGILIEEGADPTIENNEGISALRLSFADFSKKTIAKVFDRALADLNIKAIINLLKYQDYTDKLKLNNGNSPNSLNLIKFIRANGDLLEETNRDGYYLRDVAMEKGFFLLCRGH